MKRTFIDYRAANPSHVDWRKARVPELKVLSDEQICRETEKKRRQRERKKQREKERKQAEAVEKKENVIFFFYSCYSCVFFIALKYYLVTVVY